MLKPDGQVFMVFLDDNVVKTSFNKQMMEKSWAKYTPIKQVFGEYTENPEQYINDLLQKIGFEIDVCEHEIASVVIENFAGKIDSINRLKKLSNQSYLDFIKPLIQMYDDLHLIPSELQEEFFQYHLKNCREACTYLREPDVYLQTYGQTVVLATKSV